MSAIISGEYMRRLEAVLSSGKLHVLESQALKAALHVLRDRRDERTKHPWETMNRASIDKSRAKRAGKL